MRKRQRAITLKRKLKRQFCLGRQYKTTFKDIKKYFKAFNAVIFDRELSPFGQVEIKNLSRQNCIGQVVTMEWKRRGTRLYKLEMEPSYKSRKDFLDTLVHEMVHLFQMQNKGNNGGHNDMFWSFQDKVEYIGLRL